MSSMSSTQSPLRDRSGSYLDYLEQWYADLPGTSMDSIVEEAGSADRIAIVSVDLIVGFCHQGPLSSPRAAGILQNARELFQRAHDAGVTHYVLPQDAHPPDAEEFGSYPPHCIADTDEAQTVPELSSLSFSGGFSVVEKNSISSVIEPAFSDWEAANGPFSTYIIVGVCTDLCVYQAAMMLKLRSVGQHLGQRIIVPANGVETFDITVEDAAHTGAQPHPGDFLHHVFLHSMAQNGVEIVGRIT